MIRYFFLGFAALVPWFLRRVLLKWLCNAKFGKNAYVGRSFVDIRCLVLGEGARIGSLNIFRHVREVNLDTKASIGNLNWFSGASHKTSTGRNGEYLSGSLRMMDGAALTNRHYVDMHGDIEIGSMSLLAGIRSTVLTHSIDFRNCSQKIKTIKIGAYSFVGTNSVLLPGCYVPSRSIVGAGAVVVGKLPEGGCLYGGIPAVFLKKLPVQSFRFFDREDSFVE